MTAIGWRAAVAGPTRRPVIGAGTSCGVGEALGSGLGEGLGSGLGEGDGAGLGDGLGEGICAGEGDDWTTAEPHAEAIRATSSMATAMRSNLTAATGYSGRAIDRPRLGLRYKITIEVRHIMDKQGIQTDQPGNGAVVEDVEVVSVSGGAIRAAKAEAIDVSSGAIGAANAETIDVSLGAVGAIRATTAAIDTAAVGAVAASEVRIDTAFIGPILAREVHLERAIAQSVLAQRVSVHGNALTMFLVAQRVDGNVRAMFDWRGGLAFGAVFGLIVGVFRLVRGR